MIFIMGHTCSGKDSIAEELRHIYGMKILPSFTTRPKRPWEKNGREHTFISDEDMSNIDISKIFAYRRDRNFQYCATVRQVKENDVYVVAPLDIMHASFKFPEIFDNDLFVYLYADYDELKQRYLAERGSLTHSEFEARYQSDKYQFDDMKSIQNLSKLGSGELIMIDTTFATTKESAVYIYSKLKES